MDTTLWGNTLYSGLPDRGAHELITATLPLADVSPVSDAVVPEVFPNPTYGMFTLRFNIQWKHVKMQILDSTGKMLREASDVQSGDLISLYEYRPGVYYITLYDVNGQRLAGIPVIRQ